MPEALELLPNQLFVLLTDPTSNLSAALILYGIIGILVLILLVLAILFLMTGPEDEYEEVVAADGTTIETRPVAAPRRKQKVVREWTLRSFALSSGVFLGVTLAVWLLAGYTTSTAVVCEGCHVDTPHVSAEEDLDPHVNRACVTCHEPGGVTGRYFTGVPARLVHFADGLAERSMQDQYGRVTSSACNSCHASDIEDPTLNEERALRMSHIEPLEASARCTDCHTLRAGIVATYNAGMNPCLRCHDSRTASSECSTCHDANAAASARARTTDFASVQIPEVSCGGCHDEKKECDPCHGTRMPHSKVFMASSHARAGAVNFWYEDGKTCAACHTPARRPCTRCHQPMLGQAHGPGLAEGHRQSTQSGCDSCHQRFAPSNTRDFCLDVCHSEVAIAESPR